MDYRHKGGNDDGRKLIAKSTFFKNNPHFAHHAQRKFPSIPTAYNFLKEMHPHFVGSEMCRANSEQDRLGPVSHIKIDKFHFV